MQRSIEAFSADVGFVYTRVNLHKEDTAIIEPSTMHPPGLQPMERIVQHLLSKPLTLSPGCAVFRREDALECLPPFVPEASGEFGPGTGVGEDLLLFLLTSLRYPSYVHVPEHLADFLAHEASITVGACASGNRHALNAAYQTAKRHYLDQSGAISPLPGTAGRIASISWIIGSRALPSYARKAWLRLSAAYSGRSGRRRSPPRASRARPPPGRCADPSPAPRSGRVPPPGRMVVCSSSTRISCRG